MNLPECILDMPPKAAGKIKKVLAKVIPYNQLIKDIKGFIRGYDTEN